jgi:hypothetical protein
MAAPSRGAPFHEAVHDEREEDRDPDHRHEIHRAVAIGL